MLQRRIEERKKIRAKIANEGNFSAAFLLISESLDDYIEHGIETSKALTGILKDIQGIVSEAIAK